jgi:hypothetical protein
MGMLICNAPARGFDSLTIDEIKQRIESYRQVEVTVRGEKPKTGHDLKTLIWGGRV